MSTFAGEITSQMKESRKTVERSLSDIQDQIGAESISRAGMVVAGAMVTALAVGLGWMVYQRRRRRSLFERLQAAIPDAVKDLPVEVRARVKAL
jgi:sensor c-di-GMP phosphodiesterase-like protein